MRYIRPALMLIGIFTLLTGVVLPLAFVGLGQALFPVQAGGNLIEHDGKVVGSTLIGQSFSSDRYFWGRPSATTRPDPADSSKTLADPYNAASSGASNLGPTNSALIERVKRDVAKLGRGPVPADAVTTSASGLDPDISPENADRQIGRVAAARRLPETRLRALVAAHTEWRVLGVIGEPRVNVLELNLALDRLASG